ncbi:MAG: hypothetical protein H0U74_09720 [Bradymonadaceae bacterium]|nr:hypothetical protein [Lujinxingiaceae bacterium]
MSEFIGHSSFIRPIVIEVDGICVEGVVTQMLPFCVEVSIVSAHEGLYVEARFELERDAGAGGLERLLDEELPGRLLLELWRVGELFEERFEGLRERFLMLEELRRGAWRGVQEVDMGRLQELLAERGSGWIHGFGLALQRRAEVSRVFEGLGALHEAVYEAQALAIEELLPELGEMEFARAVEMGRLTEFGMRLWRRLALRVGSRSLKCRANR